IFQVSVRGGKAEPLTKMDGSGGSHQFPSFLPDGRHFLYSSANGIYVAALDGSQTSRILDAGGAEYSSTGNLVFLRGDRLLAQRFDQVWLTLIGDPAPLADHVLRAAPGYSVSDAGPIIYRTASARPDATPQLCLVRPVRQGVGTDSYSFG